MNSEVTFVNAHEVNDRLAGHCQVIDVREPSEFNSIHISGSHLMPLSKLETFYDQLDGSIPIYLVCKTGSRARQAANKLCDYLRKDGVPNINVLQGGLVAWEQAGFPLERQASSIWSMDRQVRLTAGLLILTGISLAYTISPFWIYLSAFVSLGMVLSAVTDSCGMALMLAKMPWNRVEQFNSCANRCQNKVIG